MNCTKCGVKITDKNKQKYGVYTRKQCKECLKKDVQKYNKKKRDAIKKAGRWF